MNAEVSTAAVANVLLSRGYRNVVMQGIKPLSDEQPLLIGPAYTLRFIPAREDLDSMENYARSDNLHRRAIEECPAGSVLVIDSGPSTAASSMGDMMARRLRARGVAGAVTDGGFRDARGIVGVGLPAFHSAGAVRATPIALHPVALDEPVACGGVAVYPGDVLFGDHDGVVVIPRHLADEVWDEARSVVDYERYAMGELERGASLFGLFPATPESRLDYDGWAASRRQREE